jgi:hypothetical protein
VGKPSSLERRIVSLSADKLDAAAAAIRFALDLRPAGPFLVGFAAIPRKKIHEEEVGERFREREEILRSL